MSKEVMEKGLNVDSSDEDIAKLYQTADAMLAIIVIDLPNDVRDKLRIDQKTAIVEAFTTVASKKRAEKATGERESQKTTDDSSPGSEDSTEAHSATG